ncbi:hypothetical protein CBOM_02220 [Ceraceosorus bombacis]|uniref:OTU domain-containing protein n=1 Tax=Ceraceosorus bombacis TaxID=401625 RepID=A0A0P1BE21_9BASI|nr:hypothetical protein CBOM_02220 [Ceraceosorus bombacis]
MLSPEPPAFINQHALHAQQPEQPTLFITQHEHHVQPPGPQFMASPSLDSEDDHSASDYNPEPNSPASIACTDDMEVDEEQAEEAVSDKGKGRDPLRHKKYNEKLAKKPAEEWMEMTGAKQGGMDLWVEVPSMEEVRQARKQQEQVESLVGEVKAGVSKEVDEVRGQMKKLSEKVQEIENNQVKILKGQEEIMEMLKKARLLVRFYWTPGSADILLKIVTTQARVLVEVQRGYYPFFVSGLAPINSRWTLPRDLDGYNMTLFPEDLLEPFGPEALVQLCSFKPTIWDLKEFQDWVYVGSAVQYFKIEPFFKLPLLHYLATHVTVEEGHHPQTLIAGKQSVHLSRLVLGLESIGCNARSTGSSIPLFRPMGRNTPGTRLFPMLGEVGRGFGSVEIKLAYEEQAHRVKIYPTLVHRLKAQAGKHYRFGPKSNFTAKGTLTSLVNRHTKLFKALQQDRSCFGGYRIEVTVQNPTLPAAISLISKTPLLNLAEWQKPLSEELEGFVIQEHLVSSQVYLQQFKRLLHKAQGLKLFSHKNTEPPSRLGKQVLVDLANALGWNPGLRKPTEPWDTSAWWIVPAVLPTSPSPSVASPEAPWQEVNLANLTDVPLLRELFDLLKPHMICRWCQDPQSRYTRSWDRDITKQQRFRCSRKANGACPGPQLYLQREIPLFTWWVNHLRLELHPKFAAAAQRATEQLQALRLDLQEPQQAPVQAPSQRGRRGTAGRGRGSKRGPARGRAAPASDAPPSQVLGNGMVASAFIKGNGNCQFRAWAHLQYGDQAKHWVARRGSVHWLKNHRAHMEEMYAPDEATHLDGCPVLEQSNRKAYDSYLKDMGVSGNWGDEYSLIGLVNHFNQPARLISFSEQLGAWTEYTIEPYVLPQPAPAPFTFFFANKHYEVMLAE